MENNKNMNNDIDFNISGIRPCSECNWYRDLRDSRRSTKGVGDCKQHCVTVTSDGKVAYHVWLGSCFVEKNLMNNAELLKAFINRRKLNND